MIVKDTLNYCDDVLAGRVISGELMKLAIKRHLTDLDLARNKKIDFVYSEKHAQHAIDFIKKMRHTAGIKARQLFDLQLNQAFQASVVFGWLGRHAESGLMARRFTRVYDEKARKGGKSEELAAIGNYLLLNDGEDGAEIYSAATKLKQAEIVFKRSKSMLRKFKSDYPGLSTYLEVSKSNIAFTFTDSLYEPLPSDSDKLDGLNPSAALIDEVHEHPDDSLIKVLETGMGSRVQPLLYMITTAGFNIYGAGYKIRQDNVKVLRGITNDDRSVAFIYSLDDGDDWHDERNWYKPNPNLGKAPFLTYLRDQYRKAVNDGGSSIIQFRTKNLNQWMTTGATWLSDEEWVRSDTYDAEREHRLRGRSCFIGMDLSTNFDLTVIIAIFPPNDEDDYVYVECAFICPEETIDEKSKTDRVNYALWSDESYIKATPGNVINYDYLVTTLADWRKKFNIIRLDYDTSFSYQLIPKIEALGIKCYPYGQNTRDMNPPIMAIERDVASQKLKHNMHPILRWNVSNVMLYVDSNGKKKFDKRKVVDRIDGCVALAMAYGGWLSEPQYGKSKYNDESLFPGMV